MRDERGELGGFARLSAAGSFAVDVGGLAEGGRMQQNVTGPLAALNLIELP